MRRLEWGTIAIVILWILVGLWMVLYSQHVGAQNAPILICLDTINGAPRFEFRNMPHSWFEYGNPDAPVWGYWGQASMSPDEGRMIIDPLEQDADGYRAGTVALVDYTDGWTLIGDAKTAPCDPSPIIPTPEPAMTQIPILTGRTCVVQYPKVILV